MRRRALLQANGEIDYSKRYLTFEALEAGTFSLVVPAGITSTHITGGVSYSIDDGATWTTTAITSSAQTITTPTINAGGKVLWKAVANRFATSTSNYCKFTATGNFDVSGNIMSLEYGDNFVGQTALKNYTYSMAGLFSENTKIISVENLILPATTLASNCYCQMFYDCTSLTTAPELPATTLENNCYQSMFYGCSSLTTSPELHATTLARSCYYWMFYDCTSLTTAPELPATTLASNCYCQMFYDCTSLTTAPELPATTLENNCYQSMFRGCSSLTTSPELHATTLASSCYESMFYGCSSLTTAPELPATTLATYCYAYMFLRCTSLTIAPKLPATTLKPMCYNYMFYGCSSLSSITCLATDISASNCTKNWVSGVASSGTFTKAASMSGWTTGNNGIPSGWTTVDA